MGQTKKANILIVDDVPANLIALEAALKRPDYNIVTATSAREALAHLISYQFAVILLDVMMPEMDGFELAERIKQHDRRRYVPIVFVTAVAKEELQRAKGYAVGAIDYLVKPLDVEVVKAKVAAFVELYRKTEQLHETQEELEQLNRELSQRVAERTRELERSLQETKRALEEKATSEAALKTVKERLELAQKASKLVTWDWEIDSGQITWSENSREVCGYAPQEVANVERWWEHIHPDDRKWLNEHVTNALKNQSYYQADFRVVWPDGSIHWLTGRGQVYQGRDGNPEKMVGINIDITTLKGIQEELIRSNQELERFAYVASHDLQEPLRMISAYVSLIEKKLAGNADEDIRQFIRFAVDGAERMRNLINALLAYSKAERVKEKVKTGNVRLAVDEALTLLGVAIKETEAKVSVGELPEVEGHFPELVRLFQNLVGNAIKYRGAEAPDIKIGCDTIGRDWIFCVRDNGIGFDMKHSERIFEVFQRLHSKSEYEGTGFGLAICKRIVEAHGGRIWAESTPGEGSAFFFTLPARAPAAEAVPPRTIVDNREQEEPTTTDHNSG